MKELLNVCLCFSVLIILSGCFSHRMNVRPRLLQDDAIPKLNTEHSVAVKRLCNQKGEREICSAGVRTFNGDPCDFTGVAKDIMKDALQREHIAVVDNNEADKILSLSLEKAYCTGMGTAVVWLKVKTGDGLEMVFQENKHAIASPFENTRNFEIALNKAVERMINNDEILNYLANR